MEHPLDKDEIAILDDDTLRVFSYYDRDTDERRYFEDPIEFTPGDELILGHVSPEAGFRYLQTIRRDGDPYFKFDCPISDFPVTELVLSPNDFMREMGDSIWYY